MLRKIPEGVRLPCCGKAPVGWVGGRLRPGRCRPHGGRCPGAPLDFGFPARRTPGRCEGWGRPKLAGGSELSRRSLLLTSVRRPSVCPFHGRSNSINFCSVGDGVVFFR